MYRYKSSGQGRFARYGLDNHGIRTTSVYRGGTRL